MNSKFHRVIYTANTVLKLSGQCFLGVFGTFGRCLFNGFGCSVDVWSDFVCILCQLFCTVELLCLFVWTLSFACFFWSLNFCIFLFRSLNFWVNCCINVFLSLQLVHTFCQLFDMLMLLHLRERCVVLASCFWVSQEFHGDRRWRKHLAKLGRQRGSRLMTSVRMHEPALNLTWLRLIQIDSGFPKFPSVWKATAGKAEM